MKPIKEVCSGDSYSDEGSPPREDKYKAMILTPEGSIIAIGDPNKARKPETDPDWEERKAKWDAERKRDDTGKKRAHASWTFNTHHTDFGSLCQTFNG